MSLRPRILRLFLTLLTFCQIGLHGTEIDRGHATVPFFPICSITGKVVDESGKGVVGSVFKSLRIPAARAIKPYVVRLNKTKVMQSVHIRSAAMQTKLQKWFSTSGTIAKLGEKLNVSNYSNSVKHSARDAMTPDHIPSFAAMRVHLEEKLLRPLTEKELLKLRSEGTTLLYETSLHQKFSRTYGGRNTVKQINSDSKNLFEAAKKDLEAIRKPLIDSGVSPSDVEKAFELIHKMNKEKGLY